MIKNKELKRRIIEISYKLKLGHIGSCLTAIDIIDEIYKIKKPDEKFVLSAGHAGLALYVVLEKYTGKNAEEIFNHHGVHPDRCDECGLDCSSGSLGQGFPIALGMALADRSRNVYCLLSDGECSEGSVWEAFNIIMQHNLKNLKVYINYNGWGAYRNTWYSPEMRLMTDTAKQNIISNRDFVTVCETHMNDYPEWLQGQIAHYKVLNEYEYKEMMEIL